MAILRIFTNNTDSGKSALNELSHSLISIVCPLVIEICKRIYYMIIGVQFLNTNRSTLGNSALKLIDWGLTPFLTISQLYHGGQSPTHAFPGFLTPVLHTTIFPRNWLLFHIDLAHWWKTNYEYH